MRRNVADAYNSPDMEFGHIRLLLPQAKGDANAKAVFRAVIASDFNFGGSNTFESPLEGTGMISKSMDGINNLRAGVGLAGGKSAQVASKAKSQSILFYQGSSKPPLSFEFCIMCTNSSQSIIEQTNLLLSTVYPTGQEILTAPLGYSPKIAKETGKEDLVTYAPRASGTVSLKIGKWFYARNLVVKDVSLAFSKEVTRTGEPLYATGSVTLEPYRAVSFDEIKGYFTKNKNPANLSQNPLASITNKAKNMFGKFQTFRV